VRRALRPPNPAGPEIMGLSPFANRPVAVPVGRQSRSRSGAEASVTENPPSFSAIFMMKLCRRERSPRLVPQHSIAGRLFSAPDCCRGDEPCGRPSCQDSVDAPFRGGSMRRAMRRPRSGSESVNANPVPCWIPAVADSLHPCQSNGALLMTRTTAEARNRPNEPACHCGRSEVWIQYCEARSQEIAAPVDV